MRCPMCETENREGALDCAGCGKVLLDFPELIGEVVPVPGLEQTLQESVEPEEISPLAGLEQTQLAPPGLRVAMEVVPDVLRTQIEADDGAPVNWTRGQFDPHRAPEEDLPAHSRAAGHRALPLVQRARHRRGLRQLRPPALALLGPSR